LDPIAHTLTGAALSASGVRRVTPLATAALLIGANAPDIDALAYFGADFQSLAFRRGWTHGVLSLAILPFVVAALLLLWDRCVRLPRRPDAAPARAPPLLGIAALGVLTHPALDWLNNYGLRWLMPFDGRWFYGDAVFIIDPWIWLAFGGVAFLLYSRRSASLYAWCAFWILTSLLVLMTAGVPLIARGLWLLGIVGAFVLRARLLADPVRDASIERTARIALGVAALYVGTLASADFAERALVRAELAARRIAPIEQVMVAPVAANPFAGQVVVVTPSAYYTGSWHWLGRPRLVLEPASLARRPEDPIAAAAARTPEARRFLVWARFPYVEVDSTGDEHIVRFRDARYGGTGRLGGPTVRLDYALQPLPSD
jgi:inner membrane protein